MQQKLAEQKFVKTLKKDTQGFQITEIWKNMDKSSFEKETDPSLKEQKKGELYTKIMEKYEEKFGTKVSRPVVRRCVNAYINQNSQG